MSTNIPLSGARLWDSLMEMAKIGGTPKGGSNRQTLTEVDNQGRHLLARWAQQVGCTLTVDRVGNMMLRREGTDPKAKPVAFGSHLDTQPTGGKFDGVLGVLAGLELMRAVHEAGIQTRAPLLLINWTNEEGARFAPPMMGSGVAMGVFTEDEILAKQDQEGAVFGKELEAIGWRGEADPTVLRDCAAYFELHIEQGKILEDEGLELGVVDRALAQNWLEVVVTGEDAHGGSPMAGRRDAMMGAAKLISALEEIALTTLAPDGEPGRATVGQMRLYPSSRNVAPSEVWFSVDTRHSDVPALDLMASKLREAGAAIAAERGLGIEVKDFWYSPLTPFDAKLVAHCQASAKARGLKWKTMPTGIGHDAVYMARHVPTVMIFTPCHGGLSHNEAESITPEWAEAGLKVLADGVLATAEVVKA